MRVDLTLFASFAALIVGVLAFWSNPRRPINRAFLTLSIHATAWLLCLRTAFTSAEGLFWLRMSCAVGAVVPLHLWFAKESIASADERFLRMVWRSRWWAVAGAMLALVSFTHWFIPTAQTTQIRSAQVYGSGYYVYIGGLLCLYAALCREAVLQIRANTGFRRLELQVVLLGGIAAAGGVILLMALRALLSAPWLVRLQPAIILTFYAGTAIAITTRRVFNARQLVLTAAHKLTLVAVVAAGAYLCDEIIQLVLPEPFALLATVAIVLWCANELNVALNRLFHFYPGAKSARQAAFAVAQRETRVDRLETAFLGVLKGWGQTENAVILSGSKQLLTGGGVELSSDGAVVQAMRKLRWATPERLARERSTAERVAVGGFLAERRLGALVLEEGPSLTVLVGVGVGSSRRPVTYPHVTQLMELASIVEGALERALVLAKAQHAEQLATVGLVGASLAHEIRNPLVSIKMFVQLLPTHYQDPVFRDKFFRLIGQEVARIDNLTEQLLDLASPRDYVAQLIDLHPVLEDSLELVAAKAAQKNVQFLTEFHATPDRAYTDASAAKQVMLNLCFNAIQAAELHDSEERWVKIGTRNTPAGIEMAVADSGPGIPPEIRPRLFQPFQTTKSTGFGLGLAICSNILANLNASIAVDPPEPGRGATFRVTFPCQPLSS